MNSERSLSRQIYLFCLILLLPCGNLLAQSLYATMLSTKGFVVGAKRQVTGLFFNNELSDTTWVHSGSPNTRTFDFCANGDHLFMATGNGVHRSLDGGKTWKIVTDWRITEVLKIAMEPRDSRHLYVATAYGIFESRDEGDSWQARNEGLSSTFTSSILIDKNNPAHLFCATDEGLFMSRNSGRRWTKTTLSNQAVLLIVQHPDDPDILIAGTENNGLFGTTDGGKHWSLLDSTLQGQTFYSLVFDPVSPNILYAGGHHTAVYKSMDGGLHWRRYDAGLTTTDVHSLAINPANSSELFAGTLWGGIFRSYDAGEHWVYAGLAQTQIWRVGFVDLPALLR